MARTPQRLLKLVVISGLRSTVAQDSRMTLYGPVSWRQRMSYRVTGSLGLQGEKRPVLVRTLAGRFAAQITALALSVVSFALVSSGASDRSSRPFANFEAAQTNPIRLSADRTRLFAVNTANASLSVFDVTQPRTPALLAEIPVGVGPVSVNPRTNDEAWVVNQVSNSVSVVSVSKGIVTDTIPSGAGTEPMDIVFAGVSQAYVSCSRTNTIAVFDANTHALITTIPVFGGSPRALAVSNDGGTVYAAFAVSGNATTIIPPKLSPPQPAPIRAGLPPPPQVALVVAATDPKWTSYIHFKMPDNDVVAITTGLSPSVAGYYSAVGTINLGLAVNPVTGDLFVANTDALNLTFFQPNLRGHWVNNRLTRIQVANGQVSPFDLNPNINYKILPNPAALKTALAQPAGLVFDPGGNFLYLAAFGTDRVAKVDVNGNVLTFVEISPSGSGSKVDPRHKRGPRGLALNPAAQTLYSMNRISNTISVIDTSQMVVSTEIPVGTDLTPRRIKEGRGFLYDAKLSGNGTGACASCHVDADMDHLAWDLGDPGGKITYIHQHGNKIPFHPMKGPMVTLTLRGLLNLSPYHWRGDFINFAAFNTTLDKLMGGAILPKADLDTYHAFINSILFLPNPNQNLDRTLPTSLAGGDPVTGLVDYLTIPGTGVSKQTCNDCHTADPGPGTNRIVMPKFHPQPMKTPELRNIYQKLLYTRHDPASIDGFGIEHDGHFSTAGDLLALTIFNYTSQQKTDIISYLLCFDTGTAPAVGYTITLTAANVNGQKQQSDWATLQSQSAAANIDLIARGTIQGKVIGLLYQPGSMNYLSDKKALYTQQQLQTFIEGGDTLSFMGVSPGTGSTSSGNF
jgi:YVTN family beta-propeller protein